MDEQKRKSKNERAPRLTDDQEAQLKDLKLQEKRLKDNLLLSLRAEMSDAFVQWQDACVALTSENRSFTPLLGSGGVEGSMDFSINHLALLKDLIDPFTDAATPLAVSSIDHALFGGACVIPERSKPGFLNPGVANGPNMSTGFSGEEGDNPWNAVLMLEGSLLFAAAISKKGVSSTGTFASFPFTFKTSRAGHGSLGVAEKSKEEFWAPIWKSHASIRELTALISEGRATVGQKSAKNGLDMVRSVNSLGVDRGLIAFERYGFFERRGKGYSVAAPIGRFLVKPNPASKLIDDLNDWLLSLRAYTKGKDVAKRFLNLQRTLEDRLVLLSSRHQSAVSVQSVLDALGKIQYALSESEKAQKKIAPAPQLSERWTEAANDWTPAFRIARAIAGLHGVKEHPLPLRSQLFPIHHANGNQWLQKARNCKDTKMDPACILRLQVARQCDLLSTLNELLRTRLSLPARLGFADKPLSSSVGIDLADLTAFLSDARMDARIAALLPGLTLCKLPPTASRIAGDGEIHPAFALCKLAVTPDQTLRGLGLLSPQDRLPVPARLLSKLASGNADQAKQAIEIAWRRLRHSGIKPAMPSNQLPDVAGLDSRRLAPALLIPLNFGATGALANAVLQTDPNLTTTDAA